MKIFQPNEIRNFEERRIQEDQFKKVYKRASLQGGLSVKRSLIVMLGGIIAAVLLTVFEYAMKNPAFEGVLQTLFTVGFFVSLVGILLFPYGLYNFIKRFKRPEEN